jgi:hypothetical protein
MTKNYTMNTGIVAVLLALTILFRSATLRIRTCAA